MPRSGWTNKDERMYDHVKSSLKEDGKSTDDAERIAAATVNRERSSEGRTKEPQSKAKQERSQKAQERASSKAASKRTANAKGSTKRD